MDSGAQYMHGTTDITRTMPLGELTELEKEDYTCFKGMIDLSMLYFPKDRKDVILIVARLPYMNLQKFRTWNWTWWDIFSMYTRDRNPFARI